MKNMKNKLSLVLATIFLLTISACNSTSTSGSSSANQAATKTAEPIPQAGGYSNIDNAKLQELIKEGVTLVDIRRIEEWQQTGVVKGSKTITFFDNRGRINPNFVPEFTAITDQEKPVIIICRTGSRSQAASQAISTQLGYKKVLNVTHGITGWIAEKRPVARYTPK